MIQPLLSIASLLLAVAVLTVGNGLLNTLVSLRMSLEGFPLGLSGAVMSAYFAGVIVASLAGGKLIERVGHVRAFAGLGALLTASVLLQSLLVTPLAWLALRAATGFCICGELMVAESWLNASATSSNRGRIFSVYMSAIYLAFGGGQFLLTLSDPGASQLFEVVAILLALSIVPIVMTRTAPPAQVAGPRLGLGDLWAAAPLGVVGSSCAGLAVGAVQSLGPRFAGDVGLPVSGVSLLMGTIFLSGLILQWPVGRLSDSIDRRAVLAVISLAAAGAALGILPVGSRSGEALFLLGGLYGGFAATLYPLSVALTNDSMGSRNVVAVTGGLLLSNGLGAMAGPVLAAFAMHALGPRGLFVFVALVCLLLAAYCSWMRRSHAPARHGGHFVPVAQTTPVVMELDPRAPAPSRDLLSA